jgi:hypothetical protein
LPEGQLLKIDAPVRLSFALRAKEAHFLNYTQLPSEQLSGNIQYFTNLNSEGPLTPSEATTIASRPNIFTIKAKEVQQEISLFDELGNKLYSSANDTEDTHPTIQAINEEGTEFQINLSKEPPGRYALKEGDTMLLDFVLLPKNWKMGDIGLFSVYIGDTGTEGQYILKEGTATPTTYSIEFTARATTWRYHLIDTQEPGHEDFQLLDQASNTVVAKVPTPPEIRKLPDETKAIILTSPNPLPLRLRPGLQFTLSMKSKGGGRSTPITISLPSADALRLSREPPDSQDSSGLPRFYSDLYVYL